jgi:membrane protease YdiL (CAAX protease family)
MAVAEQPAPPRWPLWLPFAGLVCGAFFGLLCANVVASIVNRTSGPAITDANTVLVDVSVVAACILFAGLVARPEPWQFGLRQSPPKLAAQIAAIGALVYFIFGRAYEVIVRPENPQRIVEDIGANSSTLLLVVGAVVVITVAPVCEELFFRGVLFRVLRQRMPLWPAAIIDGILFGFVHGSLVIVPILAVLGIILCWVYERTGSLFPTIALHSLNNTVAYGATTHNGWVPAAIAGSLVFIGCVVGVLRAPDGAAAASATSPA